MVDCSTTSLFGESEGVIKFQGSDVVAAEGKNIVERLILSGIKIPYKQIVKGKITLKADQQDYFMNHFGLGEGVTFVLIVANYDPKSRIEEDNYIEYTYYDNIILGTYTFAQMILLTGNLDNMIPQMYLTNPNKDYPVVLDVMVATISEEYTYFPEPE